MTDLQERARRTAERLAEGIRELPAVFRDDGWPGRAMRSCLDNPDLRLSLFRFIDVLPALPDLSEVAAHLHDAFGRPGASSAEAEALGLACPDDGGPRALAAAETALRNVTELGRIFIPGRTIEEALPVLDRMRARGLAFSADVLGEAAVSEAEADRHLQHYLELLDRLTAASRRWAAPAEGLDWGFAPLVNISVKPSALYSQMRPEALEHSAGRALERLRPLMRRVAAAGAHLTMDMEGSELKDITLTLFRRLLTDPEFQDYPHLGIIVQSYRRDSESDLLDLLEWAGRRGRRFTVRLVKGAYLEAEQARAALNGWPAPVFDSKADTDANFEKLACLLLENHRLVDAACASHNLQSIAFFLEAARQLDPPARRIEFQVLYGMAEPIQDRLLQEGLPVRVYTPVGPPIPGMAYLIRRLLELTSPEAWLARGLRRPAVAGPLRPAESRGADAPPAFLNEPPRDWTMAGDRREFALALARVRRELPIEVRPLIDGKEQRGGRPFRSDNPNDPAETIGLVSAAGREEALAAVAAARQAFPSWRDTPPDRRAAVLFRSAAAARRSRDELAALQVLEVGKSWPEADADVVEAIDYLEYYGRLMLSLAAPALTARFPGEENILVYEPLGVAAVIAPWNFPLAISTGMTAAALAAGNTVVYKPSSLSPATGLRLARLLSEAGLPDGVLNFLPGPGGEVGDLLSGHPDVALVAFTGSREIGLRILERAASQPARQVRRVIAELGGKNAMIVDQDAELDEAVRHVLISAFGYQGQKCSACSRLIVHDGVYERLVRRLKDALFSLELGPPEDPRNQIGAVISEAARRRIATCIEIGRAEAELLALREPPPGPGYGAPLVLFTGVRPEHRIAREEIFGPVLSILRAGTFPEALAAAADSEYALTGGLLSRRPSHIEMARQSFRVGNLYINRPITGARVGRQPFGGFRMSGTGTKAGGPDYLLHFLAGRTVTENTLRRGFYPEIGGA